MTSSAAKTTQAAKNIWAPICGLHYEEWWNPRYIILVNIPYFYLDDIFTNYFPVPPQGNSQGWDKHNKALSKKCGLLTQEKKEHYWESNFCALLQATNTAKETHSTTCSWHAESPRKLVVLLKPFSKSDSTKLWCTVTVHAAKWLCQKKLHKQGCPDSLHGMVHNFWVLQIQFMGAANSASYW